MKWLKEILMLLWEFYKRILLPGLVAGLIVLIIFLIVNYINNRPSKPPPAPRTIGITEPTEEKGIPQIAYARTRSLSFIKECSKHWFTKAP